MGVLMILLGAARTATVLLLSLIIIGTCAVIRPVEAQTISVTNNITVIHGGSGSTTIMIGPTLLTSWGVDCGEANSLPPGVSCSGPETDTGPTTGGNVTLQFDTSLSTPIGTYNMTVNAFIAHCSAIPPEHCDGAFIVSLTSWNGTACSQGCTTFNLIVVPTLPVPFSALGSVLLNAPANTVYFIFPDSNTAHVKPAGVGYAQVTDWTALGFVYGAIANMPQISALDTNTTYVDPTTGAPKIGNSVIVLFASRLVNSLVYYYEVNGIAPLYWGFSGSWSGTEYYYTRSGQLAATMSIPVVGGGTKDMPLIEAFKDPFNIR